MFIFPAIDLFEGKAVRLYKGDYAQMTVYNDDPLRVANDFAAAGMEELGVGWYLSQRNKVSCFYLVLPDIELSDLRGFVNSKIDKFSFLDDTHSGDLGLFAENICEKLKVKPFPKILSKSFS